MTTATEALLKDHKMIRKILEEFQVENPRFPEILKTLQRVVQAHAWFEDEFLMPVLKGAPEIAKPFWQEITQEHNDIAVLLELLRETPLQHKADLENRALTLRSILEAHFDKEEKALFPLAEKTVGMDGLKDIALKMEHRKSEVRPPL